MIKDYLFNKLIQFLMKHCICDMVTFYTCCGQFDFTNVKNMFDSYVSVKES